MARTAHDKRKGETDVGSECGEKGTEWDWGSGSAFIGSQATGGNTASLCGYWDSRWGKWYPQPPLWSYSKLAYELSWWLGWQSICLRRGRPGFDPWAGQIPWRSKWQPIPVFLPGKSHGQRSLVGYSPRGRKELDPTERLHFQQVGKVGNLKSME